MAKKDNTLELQNIHAEVKTAIIKIVGDSDLILNKPNDVVTRQLTAQRKGKAKDLAEPNVWEIKMTAIHWLNGTPTDFSEEGMKHALTENVPCLTAFGFKKSFCQAVTRNKIDTYSTSFDATVNVVGVGDGLVPVKFATHSIDEKLMSPKKGAPVLVYLNRFSGWSAELTIKYMETSYSLEQIINIINLAGFGLGIGSGRTSGYGRYHIESVAEVINQ